jgi:hypothetical protein
MRPRGEISKRVSIESYPEKRAREALGTLAAVESAANEPANGAIKGATKRPTSAPMKPQTR